MTISKKILIKNFSPLFLTIILLLINTSCKKEEETYTDAIVEETFNKILHDPEIINALRMTMGISILDRVEHYLYYNDFHFLIDPDWQNNFQSENLLAEELECDYILNYDNTSFYSRMERAKIFKPRNPEICKFKDIELEKSIKNIQKHHKNVYVNETNKVLSNELFVIQFSQPQKTEHSYFQLVELRKLSSKEGIQIMMSLDVVNYQLKHYRFQFIHPDIEK